MTQPALPEPRRIKGFNVLDLIGGGLLVGLGVAVVIIASRYSLGSLRNIGPGMFPLLLGVVVVALGFAVMLEGRVSNARLARVPVRAALSISAGLGAYAFLIQPAGAIAAIFALILLGGLAEQRPRFVELILLASGLTAFMAIMLWAFPGMMPVTLLPR